jgi:ribosomal protein S18 acetylase RimI-like enzyme
MATPTARPYRSLDLPAAVELVNRCAMGGEAALVEKTHEALASEIGGPRVDPARDLRVWAGSAGELRAFARITRDPVDDEIHGRLYYAIRRSDDAGLEGEILRWAAARCLELGPRVRLVHAVNRQDQERGRRLEALGFTPFRRFHVLVRPTADVPAPALPPGFTARACRPAEDAAAYVALYNVAFIDAFRFTPLTVDDFLHDAASPSYVADRDLVLEAADGRVVAFCFAEIEAEHSELGHIASLGVHPEWRRRGLGEHLLYAALRALGAGGARAAHLYVDADSPTGATRLYARAGFTLAYTQVRYELDAQGLRALLASEP